MNFKNMTKAALMAALFLGAMMSAEAADKIVAVVNNQVITSDQMNARIELNIRQLGMDKANAAQRAAVAKRTLSGMIDEELQRQYAETAKMKLLPEDIAKAKNRAVEGVGGEAKWNSLTKGLEQSANDKLAAEALWEKIMTRDITPRVQVSTAEADRLIEELAKSRHVLNREISVIQLNSGDDAGVDKDKLAKLQELKAKAEGRENFNDLARAFSEDKSAVSGGKLGWFAAGELNPQLEEALDKMQPGQVSEPIRNPLGWYLVKLENVRTTKPIEMGPQTQAQLYFLAAPTPKDDKEIKALEGNLAKTVAELKKDFVVKAYFEKGDYAGKFEASKALGWVVVSDLDPVLGKVVEGLQPGKWSDPVTVNDTTARIYMADTRQEMPQKLSGYRERVINNIFGNRVELEARRFMQNLRQRAFLDMRL